MNVLSLSPPTDISLIKNNARVGAQIAVALRDLQTDKSEGIEKQHNDKSQGKPVVIGGSILDVHYRVLNDNLEVSSALPKTCTVSMKKQSSPRSHKQTRVCKKGKLFNN